VNHFPGSSSPSVALGEGFPECFGLFPECFRHSGKRVTPVVVVARWLSLLTLVLFFHRAKE
jgi:hypothetical protein